MKDYGRSVAFAMLAVATAGCAQTHGEPHTMTVDVIQCRDEHARECLHFYEQNWKIFRKEALARNYISGYRLLRAVPDSDDGITLILLTEYPDSLTFARAEENFQPMMRELRPEGPSLLNDVPRSEFVKNRTGYVTQPQRGLRLTD